MPAWAQNFAIVSPATAASLKAQRGTPEAGKIVRDAEAALKQTPHPMERVHTEGTLPGKGIHDESAAAEKDWPLTLNLAFAYRLTGDKRYLAQTAKFLDAWATVYKPSRNPIDETNFGNLVLALDLTRADLPPEVAEHTAALFRAMALQYLDWLDANHDKDHENWSSHRVKLAVLGAYVSGDKALIERATAAYSRQVKVNIHPDGSVNDFYKRDALHYVVYDLEPLTTAALAAKAHGQDWFHTAATGSPSVEMGVDWLLPYATGTKTHEEFVHSTVAFDAARDKAGEKGYSGPWDPKTSVELMGLAAWMDPKYRPELEKVEANTGVKAYPWLRLLVGR
ncbi:Alginate lyase [Granulicella rosea]|uniref:Alginate lyase n=2 Tax=Granulicella rosea TaxID=474952 RepID=A0A239CQB4_9BACT|nr:Alginate lyase [Granulicella rosea]